MTIQANCYRAGALLSGSHPAVSLRHSYVLGVERFLTNSIENVYYPSTRMNAGATEHPLGVRHKVNRLPYKPIRDGATQRDTRLGSSTSVHSCTHTPFHPLSG